MPISSVSKTVAFTDPVMETDLELMGKVNTYQQTKFDSGSAALQQEVNNWSAMTAIAKPELKKYANEKLVNLVNGINGMGGVNLSDINNVNSLKAMGYNIYGDQKIMDGIETTMKMKALSADAQTKLSGKDAAKYDNTVSNYLMKGYSEWASDGDPDNSRYDGPTALPEGNMNTINEKVTKYLKGLTPDSESVPQGVDPKSLGYFQVEGKWLKPDRIREAIDATTDENDALVFKAHGNAALSTVPDTDLITNLGSVYDMASSSIKGQINELEVQIKAADKDATTKLQLEAMKKQQETALSKNEAEKAQWFNKTVLTKDEREGIQSSLYKTAWRSNVTNSYSYNQQKTELKTNMPVVFAERMKLQSYEFAKTYDLAVANYELNKAKTEAEIAKIQSEAGGFGGGSAGGGLPLKQEPNTGTANQEASPEKLISQFNADYVSANYKYHRYLLNSLGANDTAGRFENVKGEWIPKKEYTAQIDKEIADVASKLDRYSTLSDAERKELDKVLPVDAQERQIIFDTRAKITGLRAFSKMARDKETEVINYGIANGHIQYDWRDIKVNVNDGKSIKQMSVEDAVALGEGKMYGDDVEISAIPGVTYPKNFGLNYIDPLDILDNKGYTLKSLKKFVAGFKGELSKDYKQAGGKMFNSYSVPIPFDGLTKTQKDVIQKQLLGYTKGDNPESINPIEGKIEYDFETNTPKYMVQVAYKKGTKQVKPEWVDVSDLMKTNTGAFGIATAFPTSNISHVWGLSLSNNGSTPFDKTNGYADAVRTTKDNYPFQVSVAPNALNGITNTKVKIVLPIGGGKTTEVSVKNLQTGTYSFPPDVDMIQRYFDVVLGTPEKKAQFYKEHGLTIPN